jgi:Flp pilus assembly pilin Flp
MVRLAKTFGREEEGASMAEYLVLLGVLVVVVTGGIAAFSGAMNTAFNNWATWISQHGSP